MNTIKFSLSAVQLKALLKEGATLDMCGPVNGTIDMYLMEVSEQAFYALFIAIYRWGRDHGKAAGTCKVITMYSPSRTKFA